MALIIEDGTGVSGANSYTTLVEQRAYALARGVVLSAVDADVEILAITAMDYIEAYRTQFQGRKTSFTYDLQFPRIGVYIDDILQGDNTIPIELKNSQNQLIIDLHNGVDISPVVLAGGFVIEDTVGPLTTKFSESVGISNQPGLTTFNSLLEPLLEPVRFLGNIRS